MRTAAGRAILKFILNLSFNSQPCVRVAAIVVSEIMDKLSPNIAPPTQAATMSASEIPLFTEIPAAMGTMAAMVPIEVPVAVPITAEIMKLPAGTDILVDGIKGKLVFQDIPEDFEIAQKLSIKFLEDYYCSDYANILDDMAKDIKIDGPHTSFTVIYKGEVLGDVALNIPGKHNVLNALATIAVCHHMGLSIEEIAEGFKVFSGTKRRFQTKFRNENVWIVDDYAHHPTEIQTTIKAAKQTNPKRLIVAFQPHRYSRTQLLQKEFGSCFVGADVLVLTDIYAASEDPIEGISGKTIVDEVKKQTGVDAVYIEKLEDIAPWLKENIQAGDLIITMGAGNIYTVGENLAQSL